MSNGNKDENEFRGGEEKEEEEVAKHNQTMKHE